MTSRLPAAASVPAAASRPPSGLEGLDPSFSRLVTVPTSRVGDERGRAGVEAVRGWHVLDNGDHLDALGVEPLGTVLCVHGNPTWSYLWRRVVQAATDRAATGADAWRVVAVDQLEMGFSERTGHPRPLARRVQDLADLTDALGLSGPVVTLGHDWGGVVSLGWAVDHPDLLAGVALLNTAVHQPDGEPLPAALRLALQPALLGASTVTTPAFLETTLRLARRPLAPGVADGYRAPYRTAARRGGIGGFVADIPVDGRHASAPELDRIADGVRHLGVPALLLWGAQDPVFSDRYLDDLLDRLPHADLHRFPDAGHLVAEDVDVAGAVLGWLDDRRSDLLGVDGAGLNGPGLEPTTPPGPVDHRPLWHAVGASADSTQTALVEMAPPGGGPPRVVSHRLLARRVRELAAGLVRAGVAPGDRVSLLVPPGADLTAVLYACLRIGAVVVIADAGLGLAGLTRAVRGARADHVVGSPTALTAARALRWPGRRISTTPLPAPVARALGVAHSLPDLVALGADALRHPGGGLPPEPAPTDTAAVLFTSGSTGPAKGVVYTHAQLAAVRDALADQYGLGPGSGLVAGFAPFALLGPALGTRTAVPDMDVTSPRTLTAGAVAQAAAAVDASAVFLSPAALANVVATGDRLTDEERRALGRVRTLLSAGAPVAPRLLSEAVRLLPNAVAHTPYGMTEGLLLTDITLDEILHAGTDGGSPDDRGRGGVCVGRPTAATQVRIDPLDGDGRPVGSPTSDADRTGEVVVSAPHVKERYDRLHLTERASRRDTGPGRWHRTGDVGHVDDDGRLWIEGRLAHVVVTADGVVTPVGLEQRIETVDGVGRAAVVGVGPRGTQQLVAVVETEPRTRASARVRGRRSRPGVAAPALTDAVRAAAGPGHRVAAVLVVPVLPTDVRHNSKIDRTRLARWAEDVLAGRRMRMP